ncbi:MAG: hypothetical protein A2Z32_03295 [Chloroflexi bacterium RBG_16_69_14]|nr:MAG: hypothetical protein A2Z32_03295 [Chloroflexi bacterium RBG_16_69_14]
MSRISGPYAAAAGGVAVAVLVLLAVIVSLPPARREDLIFEIAGAAIQVFPLAFFGVIVAELVRRRDARRADAQQRDGFLRDFLKDVVLAYNRTKATRRTLRGAGLGPSGHGRITEEQLHQLDLQILRLSDAQLDLERLKREARARGDIFRKPEPVTDALQALEKYVNSVIKEWETGRPDLTKGMGVDKLASWPKFRAFLADEDAGGSFDVAAGQIAAIEAWIWPALLGGGKRDSPKRFR